MATVLHVNAFEDNYIWLIRGQADYAAVVDPGDAEPVLAALHKHDLELSAILCTHHHWDHTGGNSDLLAQYSVPVYGPAQERIPGITHRLEDGDRVTPDGLDLTFDVLHVPGHTAGHIAYAGGDMLFCGDTLFSAGCGRLFEGSPEQMYLSLGRLAALPDRTEVYCAHEYTLANLAFARAVEPDNAALAARVAEVEALRREGRPSLPSTLGVEKQTNPFLRSDEAGVRGAAERHAGRSLDTSLEVFTELRRWKDGFRG